MHRRVFSSAPGFYPVNNNFTESPDIIKGPQGDKNHPDTQTTFQSLENISSRINERSSSLLVGLVRCSIEETLTSLQYRKYHCGLQGYKHNIWKGGKC